MSISDKLTRLSAAHTAISAAISAKGGTVAAGDGFEDFAQDIATIPQSGGADTVKPIKFFDIDGRTLLFSYSYAEAAALSELPSLPSHTGFTAQGWTHTLAQVQAAGSGQRALHVAAMYKTASGATELYMFVAKDTKLQQIKICLKMDANSSATVDWGDGTTGTISNDTSYAAEVYAEKSDYAIVGQDTVVCIKIIGGSYVLGKSGNNRSTLFDSETPPVIMAAHIGEHCHGISDNAFCYCASLNFTVIPQGVTSIGVSAFIFCNSLASVVIPQGVTSIGQSAFYNCTSLASVVIPQGVTSIGNSAFNNCYSLASIVIPQGVTSIGNSAFNNCYSLASIVIPQGVTSIGQSVFYNCTSLAYVVIPQGVTSIGQNAFQYCSNLTSVVIPQGVTSIKSNAIRNCDKLYSVDLSAIQSANQIPTLADSVTISSNVAVIWVYDSAMITAFESATNWSTYAGKYAVKG